MARLIYSAIASLDGYVADESGRFDWAVPDEDVHVFINDLQRSAGTYLYGRRMYEVMAAWETLDSDLEQPEYIRDFARIWRAADKIVYSRTLEAGSTARTRIEQEFNPEAIRWLKANLEKDIIIGGPTLAADAIGPDLWTSTTCSSLQRQSVVDCASFQAAAGSILCFSMSVDLRTAWSIFAMLRAPANKRINLTRQSVAARLSRALAGYAGALGAWQLLSKLRKILEYVCYDFYQGVLRHTDSTNGRKFS